MREVHVHAEGPGEDAAGRLTPIDFAYAVHTDVGYHTVGAKVNAIVPSLQAPERRFRRDPHSKQGRGPSRDWMAVAKSSRARNKIRQWFPRETREEQEQKGREALEYSPAAEPALREAARLSGPR